MNISRLLNPDTETLSMGHDAADDPGPLSREIHSRRATKSRSKFIDLVTASPVDAECSSLQSQHMITKGGVALSGLSVDVNDTDKQSYGVTSSSPPHDDFIFPRTTPSPSEASRSSITSTSSLGKGDPVCQLPIGSISLHSRDSSCASRNMAPTRTSHYESSDPKKGTNCKGSSHHQDHKQLMPLDTLRHSSSEDQSEYNFASDDSEEQGSENKTSYKSWNDVPLEFRCTFVEGCILDSPDRKVISHFFGRNKKCTRAIPEDVWAPFCRRHYQRTRYRNVDNFGGVQLDLVRRTVENLQKWGGVSHFELILRKRAMQAITRDERYDREQKNSRATTMQSSPHLDKNRRPEAWLVPYLGKGKSFEDILKVVDLIEEHVTDNNCKPPEFEILPFYKPGRMNLPTSKKTLKVTAKPEGIRKRQSRRAPSGSQSAVQSRSVGTAQSTPVTTPKTTPSITLRTLETRSGRGDMARERLLRTPGTLIPQSSVHSKRRHSTP